MAFCYAEQSNIMVVVADGLACLLVQWYKKLTLPVHGD